MRYLRLVLFLCVACGKSPADGPTAAFKKDRIPAGAGWQCWMGKCDRRCNGMPGAMMADGATPEPVCEQPKTAFCTTFALQKDPHWECYPNRVGCEANQKHYAAEAASGRDYSSVSACTELP